MAKKKDIYCTCPLKLGFHCPSCQAKDEPSKTKKTDEVRALQKTIEEASTQELDQAAERMAGRLRAAIYHEDAFPGVRSETLDKQAKHMAVMLMYDLAGKP